MECSTFLFYFMVRTMQTKAVINLKDYFTLVAVWEFNADYGNLIQFARLQQAIALCNQPNRWVFPTCLKPNAGQKRQRKKVTSSTSEKVLRLIEICPGQSRAFLAERLDLDLAKVGQQLRRLEKNGQVYPKPDPIDQRIKLYFASSVPSQNFRSLSYRNRNC